MKNTTERLGAAAAVAFGTLLAGAGVANADTLKPTADTIAVEPDGNPEASIRWITARSARGNPIDVQQDVHNGLVVRALPKDWAVLEGACPDKTQFAGWNFDTGEAPAPGTPSAQAYQLDAHGGFGVRVEVPAVVGNSLKVKAECVRSDENGTEVARKVLHAEIISAVKGLASNGVNWASETSEFSGAISPPPADGKNDEVDSCGGECVNGTSRREAHPIELGFALTQNQPVGGESNSGSTGFEANTNVSVVRDRGTWFRRFALGLRTRFAKIQEVIRGVRGEQVTVDASTEVVAGEVACKPRFSTGGVVVDLDLHAGAGWGRVDDRTIAPGVVVESDNRVVGIVGADLQIGGESLRAQVGGNCVLAGEEALQTCGVIIGAVAEF